MILDLYRKFYFTYAGKTYIIGVFGCPEPEDRFEDTLQLFNETIQ